MRGRNPPRRGRHSLSRRACCSRAWPGNCVPDLADCRSAGWAVVAVHWGHPRLESRHARADEPDRRRIGGSFRRAANAHRRPGASDCGHASLHARDYGRAPRNLLSPRTHAARSWVGLRLRRGPSAGIARWRQDPGRAHSGNRARRHGRRCSARARRRWRRFRPLGQRSDVRKRACRHPGGDVGRLETRTRSAGGRAQAFRMVGDLQGDGGSAARAMPISRPVKAP